MTDYILHVDENDERWHYVERQYTHFFGYPLTEEIVRCRDCLSWFRGKCHKHVFTITVDGTEYDEGAFPMDADGFCSLGTRRVDE